MGICLVLGGSKPLPGFFVALIYPQNGDLTKSLKSARKKVPQSARLSAGGGVQKLKGQCPNAPSMNLRGASLMVMHHNGDFSLFGQKVSPGRV